MALFDFGLLKKNIQDVAGHVRQIRAQIEALRREREDVAGAASARDDVKRMVKEWVQQQSTEYQAKLRVTMFDALVKPANLVAHNGVHREMTVAGAYQKLGGLASGGGAVDGALCTFFGPQLIDGLCKAIDTMEWPAEEGLPLAERAKRLEKIDGDLARLTREETALVQTARDAGVVLE